MPDGADTPMIYLASDRTKRLFSRATRGTSLSALPRPWRVFESLQGLENAAPAGILYIAFEPERASDVDWRRRVLGLRCQKRFICVPHKSSWQSIWSAIPWLKVRSLERFYVLRREGAQGRARLLRRLVMAHGLRGDSDGIWTASWEGDTLVVTSLRWKTLHVPLEKLRPLMDARREDRADFEIDEDGAFIFWPRLDVHLGWQQFAQAVDEREYLKARQRSRTFNGQYGEAIRRLRERHGLRQADIPGLTGRQVGRIERGECRATHGALNKLAMAHSMTTSEYMAELSGLLP